MSWVTFSRPYGTCQLRMPTQDCVLGYFQPVLSKLVFCGGSSHPSATTLHGSAAPHFVIPSEPRDLLCALTSNKGPTVSSQLLTKRFDRPKQLTRRGVA